MDKPSRRGVELNGNDYLWNLTAYLYENPDVVFVVYHNYNCDRFSNPRPTQNRFRKFRSENFDPRQISPDSESIYLISDILRSTLIEVGDCSPFEQDYNDELTAPYLYVYHYRAQLKNLVAERQGDASLHISPLLSYIESHYKEEYDDADAKFAKGVVNPEHLAKLWVPNQVIICSEKGHHMAYVLRDWPLRYAFEMGDKESLLLEYWSWVYDGNELKRDRKEKRVDLGSHDEVKIDQLSAYPLKYSRRELQNRLRDRGQKFWNLRCKHLVAYSGLDFYEEINYVN